MAPSVSFLKSKTSGGISYIVDFDGDGHRHIHDEQILNLQLAYALTAHKAQGSEFPCVVVLCHKSHFFADRNWLYTAVTRASKYCIVVGDRWGLRNALKKNRVNLRRTFWIGGRKRIIWRRRSNIEFRTSTTT